jgi:hypothetical protein
MSSNQQAKELYTDLPPQAYSLSRFNMHARELFVDDPDEFIRFVLTGEVPTKHQAVIDPLRNHLDSQQDLNVSRDYDSLLAITDDIVFDCQFTITPVSNPTDALTTSIHLKHNLAVGEVCASISFSLRRGLSCIQEIRPTPYHRIPNAKLGTFGTRHMVHIFFPGLVSEDRQSARLTEEENRIFYEKALRPYIEEVQPGVTSDWPPDYESEIFRATRRSGQRSLRTLILPGWSLENFGRKIRDQVEYNGVQWAEGLFFIHTIRGIKHGTQHQVTEDAAHLALHRMLEEANIPSSATLRGSWWIDVGLEFNAVETEVEAELRKDCLQWMTTSHSRVVQEALEIEAHNADRITKLGSSKYSRDLASHLPGVSGCRIEPGTRAEGPYQAAYIQLYTTDKSVTYSLQGNRHAKEITIQEAMGKEQPVQFIQKLYHTYKEASIKTPANARIEMRVPLEAGTRALLYVDHSVYRQLMLCFSRREWW